MTDQEDEMVASVWERLEMADWTEEDRRAEVNRRADKLEAAGDFSIEKNFSKLQEGGFVHFREWVEGIVAAKANGNIVFWCESNGRVVYLLETPPAAPYRPRTPGAIGRGPL